MNNNKHNIISNVVYKERHYAPSIREWTTASYSFNKNNTKYNYSNSKIINNIINSYLRLTPKSSIDVKSKRMRDLSRRSTTKQLFASRSYIKQTPNRHVITTYLYDRQQKGYVNTLYMLQHTLYNAINGLTNVNNINKKGTIYSFYNSYKPSTNKLGLNYNSAKVKKDIKLSSKPRIESVVDYFIYTKPLLSFALYKKNTIKRVFYFYFLKWVLSLIKLRVIINNRGDTICYKGNNYVLKRKMFILFKGYIIRNNSINRTLHVEYVKLFKCDLNINTVYTLNNIMYTYIYNYFNNTNRFDNKMTKYRLYSLYLYYYNVFYKKFITKFLNKQYIAIHNLYKLYVNKIKLNDMLPGLKLMLNNLFNNNVELNLVKLKYLPLNSDILTESVSIKIKKRTADLLRVLKGALTLIKMPNKIHIDNIKSIKSIKSINFINKYKGLSINNNISKNLSDKVNSTLLLMYNNNYSSLSNLFKLDYNVLDNIKYKWITGIRLDVKGRLTRRFTASRSLGKSKYKGSLKNLDVMNVPINSINKEQDMLKTPSLYMLTNRVKPNIQYSFKSSKRRIGAFGIKGWISNN